MAVTVILKNATLGQIMKVLFNRQIQIREQSFDPTDLRKEAYLQLPLLKEHTKSSPLGCTAMATGSPSSASNTKVA